MSCSAVYREFHKYAYKPKQEKEGNKESNIVHYEVYEELSKTSVYHKDLGTRLFVIKPTNITLSKKIMIPSPNTTLPES